MFNEAMFRGILLPSSGNVNDYVIFERNMQACREAIKLTDNKKLGNKTK